MMIKFNKENEYDVDTIELWGTDEDIELYEHIMSILADTLEYNKDSVENIPDTPESILELMKGKVMGDDYELISEREYSEDNPSIMEFADIVKQKANDESELDKKPYKVRYMYTARHPSTTSRGFCKKMMTRTNNGVVYRKEDIDIASKAGINKILGHKGTSYDLWRFKGGVNCNHYWKEQLYKLKDGVKDKALSSSNEIGNTSAFKPKPKDGDIANIAPSDLTNKGHHPNYKPKK